MSNESSQPSTPLNSAIDLSVVRVLRALDPIARSSKCEYFLAGATARDLILVNVHGLRPGRATRDIDFGIAVESWAQFELLKERLLATNDFSASRAQQRLTFTDSNEGISIPVDLIPFRGVASADGTIAWPPGRDIVMNVAGFEDQLDLENRTVWIPDSKTPSGIAEVPLTDIAADAFRRQVALSGPGPYLFPSDVTADGYQKTFKTVWHATLRRAGVRYFRLYDLRSTYATRLSAGGVADEWVTQLLRQGDAKVFKKYSQMKLQMKREALEKMNRQANEMPLDSCTARIQ